MLGEVLKFGQVQGFGSPQEDPAKVSKVLASGGDSARLSRIRERASSIEQERLSMRASSSTPDRASATRSSVVRTSMMRHSSIRPSLARIQEEEETMTVEEIEFRDATMKKVILLEQAERERGVDEDTIQLNRPKKEAEVRNLLSSEVKEHGRVRSVSVAKGRRRAPTLTQANMTDEIEPGDFVANDPGRRPSFWAEVKLKRVMLKEHVERISGLPEQTIVSQRFMKEVEVSQCDEILIIYSHYEQFLIDI